MSKSRETMESKEPRDSPTEKDCKSEHIPSSLGSGYLQQSALILSCCFLSNLHLKDTQCISICYFIYTPYTNLVIQDRHILCFPFYICQNTES